MTDKLATTKPTTIATVGVHNDIVVLARNPSEMTAAQGALISWADRRIALLKQEVVTAQENLDIAKKNKWKTSGWVAALSRATQRVEFYEKVKAALEAGYCIMPDLPAQTIAVRTDKRRPPSKVVKSSTHYGQHVPEVQTSSPALGEGRYVDPRPETVTWDETTKNAQGVDVTRYFAEATQFNEQFDFPMRLVRPEILEDTSRAMLLKIFDEIGILPTARSGMSPLPATLSHNDPVVVGRIVRKQGYKRHVINFLIAWWVDSRNL